MINYYDERTNSARNTGCVLNTLRGHIVNSFISTVMTFNLGEASRLPSSIIVKLLSFTLLKIHANLIQGMQTTDAMTFNQNQQQRQGVEVIENSRCECTQAIRIHKPKNEKKIRWYILLHWINRKSHNVCNAVMFAKALVSIVVMKFLISERSWIMVHWVKELE